MPFTLSHPAAVLPFLRDGRSRGPWVASALVAGSIAPDVPYFADSLVRGTFRYGLATHAVWGVPTVDVAIAAALAAGWHGLLREPLVALLPPRWADAADRLTAPAGRPPDARAAAWFALSAAAGAATHVGWDAFTHGGRLGERLLPVLGSTVHGTPLYSLLQYGFSAVALGVLACYVPHTLRCAARETAPHTEVRDTLVAGPGSGVPRGAAERARRIRLSRRARAGVGAVVAAAAVAGAAQRLAWSGLGPLSRARLTDLVPPVAFGGGAGTAAALACYAAAVRLRAARPQSPQAG